MFLIGRGLYIQLNSLSVYLNIHTTTIAECPKKCFDLKVPTPMRSGSV